MDKITSPAKKTTVVIVDDSQFLVDRLSEFFRNALNFEVVGTGSDGNEGIALYSKHRPDLITFDISMPNKRGDDAAREVLAASPQAKIIMVTAVRTNELSECMNFGVAGYMEKPLRFDDPRYVEDFIQTVREALPGISLPA